jgi:hypothetical protein
VLWQTTRMRAVVLPSDGGIGCLVVEERADPELRDGHVLVDVRVWCVSKGSGSGAWLTGDGGCGQRREHGRSDGNARCVMV